MKEGTSSWWRRPSVGVFGVSLALLGVASIVAVQSTVIEAGHERSAPHATWLFLALLAVTSVVAVLVVLTAMPLSARNAEGALATSIRWGVAVASGLRPGFVAALFPWRYWLTSEGWGKGGEALSEVVAQIGRPVDTIVNILTGDSLYETDLLPRGFVELSLLSGLVSVALWSVVGMVLLAGARRVRDVRHKLPREGANRV